jgi:hypothetical protein
VNTPRGKRQRLGKLTKEGNSLLRFLWSEATIHAARKELTGWCGTPDFKPVPAHAAEEWFDSVKTAMSRIWDATRWARLAPDWNDRNNLTLLYKSFAKYLAICVGGTATITSELNIYANSPPLIFRRPGYITVMTS